MTGQNSRGFMERKSLENLINKARVMSVNDWIISQQDGDELQVKHVKEGNLILTGILNKRTKQLFLVAERPVEQ